MAQEKSTTTKAPYGEFDIGDQVNHPKWGIGTILFRSGTGEGTKVIVIFPEEGQKKLALKYAKLKKVQEGKISLTASPKPSKAGPAKAKDEEPKKAKSAEATEEANDAEEDDPPPEEIDDEALGKDIDEKGLEELGKGKPGEGD